MRKLFVVLLCAVLFVNFAACFGQVNHIEEITTPETTEEAYEMQPTVWNLRVPWDNGWPPLPFEVRPLADISGFDRSIPAGYSYQMHVFAHTNALDTPIRFTYPQFSGMNDAAQQARVNHFIRDFVLRWVGHGGEIDEDGRYPIDTIAYLNVNSRVMLATPEIISIVFEGREQSTFIAYPDGEMQVLLVGSENFALGLTFDVNTLQTFTLTDFVAIDETLAANMLATERIFNHLHIEGDDWLSTFRLGHAQNSLEYLTSRLLRTENYALGHRFYVTPTSLAIQPPHLLNRSYLWVEVLFVSNT